MKIAIFTNNYLPNPYGVSTSIESFRVELEKMGHSVYIFAPRFKNYKEENPNVFRYPSLKFRFRGIIYPIAIPFSFRMDKVLKKIDIDIVHSQHPNILGWQAKRWAKKKNVPLIFTWHTLYDKYSHFAPIIPKKLAEWWAIGNAVRFANQADYVIVPTPSIKKIIKGWKVTNENIASISSGIVEEKFFNPDFGVIRKKYGIEKDDILILLVCRLTAEKNVNFIFDALIPLLKEKKNLKFVIAGEGQEKQKIEKIVEDNKLEDKIFFAGIVTHDEIKNYYAAADIFVYASTTETQGMILTEAMYMGIPIVAVKATGSRDLIGNHISGILTNENADEFSAAIERLSYDKEFGIKLSKNAKKIAHEHFTSTACTKKLLNIYKKAIRNK